MVKSTAFEAVTGAKVSQARSAFGGSNPPTWISQFQPPSIQEGNPTRPIAVSRDAVSPCKTGTRVRPLVKVYLSRGEAVKGLYTATCLGALWDPGTESPRDAANAEENSRVERG